MLDLLIIVTSDEPWGPVFHTQLRFSKELSKKNTVVYVNPPSKWGEFSNISKPLTKVSDDLYLYSYVNVFPVRVFKKISIFLNDLFNSFCLKIQLSKFSYKNIIFWRFDHLRFIYLFFFNKITKIYHVVDEYINHTYDAYLANVSDLIICVSPQFVDHYKKYNNNVVNIPQGINPEEFNIDKEMVDSLKHKYSLDSIIYTGTISEEIDLILLYEIASMFKNNTLLLLGPVVLNTIDSKKLFQVICDLDNVHYLGIINGSELKNYINIAKVCIIPYKFPDQKRVSVRSPLKVIAYISQFKPVVTSIECEIPSLDKEVICRVLSRHEFIRVLGKIINDRSTINKKLITDYLNSQTYEKQLNMIFKHLKL